MNELKKVSDTDLKGWCRNGQLPDEMVLIDIREPNEYVREHIPGSINIPINTLSQESIEQFKDKTIVFYCRLGNRTQGAKDKLMMLNLKQAYCLPQGIEQWKKCQLPIVKNANAPIEVMRQVQITAGTLVVTGVVLAWLVHPYFIGISAFVGAGLMFAGISGTCAMATILAKMPWNRMND